MGQRGQQELSCVLPTLQGGGISMDGPHVEVGSGVGWGWGWTPRDRSPVEELRLSSAGSREPQRVSILPS